MTALNFGKLADQIYDKKGKIAEKQAELDKLDGERRELEGKLLSAMQEAGTDIVRGAKATVSLSTNERYQIADMELLQPFLLRRKAIHLFERRLSAAACREMVETLGGKPIPGVNVFSQVRLNVRKV